MRKLFQVIVLAVASLLPSALKADAYCDYTQIQDTLTNTDGTPFTGTITISWPSFKLRSGQIQKAGSMPVVVTSGALSVSLCATSDVPYSAVYTDNTGAIVKSDWNVARSASPVTLSSVTSGASGSVSVSPSTAQMSNRVSTGLNFVADGDSLTAGFGNPAGSNWPAFLMSLSTYRGRVRSTPYNFAVSGNKCSDVVGRYATSAHPISPAVTGIPGQLAVWCGTNDINTAGAIPLSTIESNLSTEWSNARTDGFKVIAFTVMLYGGVPGADSIGTKESIRQQLNQWIRSQYGSWDYLVDVDQLFPNPYDQTFFQSDNTHLNVVGDQLLARFINATVWSDGVINPVNLPRSPIGTGAGNWRADAQNLSSITTGQSNSAAGWYAGHNATTATNNTFFGYNAGQNVTTGGTNALFGFQAGNALVDGVNSSFFGSRAGILSAHDFNNSFFGKDAGASVNGGSSNAFFGSQSGTSCTTCASSQAFGYNANLGATVSGAAQIGTGTNSLSNSLQFQAVIVTRAAGTFSTLPTCAAGIEGSSAPVTDSTTATYAATITGSGTNHVRAYCNGTNWVVD